MNTVSPVLIMSTLHYMKGLIMKKATTKRERKNGIKDEHGIRITETSSERIVKVLVDHYTILKFKNITEANVYINKKRKEEKERNVPETSYIII